MPEDPPPHPEHRSVPVGWSAAGGVVAAGVALGAGELVAGIDRSGVSLVSSVGEEFIDRFGAELEDLAVELFGTNDKAALVVGIVTVSLLIGAGLGVAALRRRWLGPAGFALFGVVGGLSFQRAPLTSAGVGWVAAVVAAGAGTATLLFLLHLAPRRSLTRTPPDRSPIAEGVSIGDDIGVAPRTPDAPGSRQPDRRRFLAAAGALGAGAAGVALLGRRAGSSDPVADARRSVRVPEARPVGSVPGSSTVPVDGVSPYVTPLPDFYRIDTALTVPRLDPERWELTVTGRVDRPFTVTYRELLAMDAVEVPVTLQCVSNEVGGDLVGTAVWQGVPLAHLLGRAAVHPDATQVIGRSVDGFTAGFPAGTATDGRTALVAYAMNGELLPARHGFPARLVVAGLYGYVSATKWLTEIELTRWEDEDGYWVPRGWSKEGPIKTASRIDVPRAGAELEAGEVAVAGVAWAPGRGISAVDVRVDDGGWQPCHLGATASDETWVQWYLPWTASPGEHVLTVRATDGDGVVQSAAVAPPRPDGATGLHARRVRVRSS